MELRTYNLSELRAVDAGADGQSIQGYAALFNSMSEDLGGFVEIVMPGAFTNTLEHDDQRDLWQHDTKMVMGRKKAGTLELQEDEVGLRFKVTPPNTSWAQDAMVSVQRGDVDQMSFGFDTVRDRWEQRGELVVRYLDEVKLYEVSQVTFAAYPQTSAHVREHVKELRAAMQQAGSDENGAAADTQEGAGSDAGADAQQQELLELELKQKRLDLAELES